MVGAGTTSKGKANAVLREWRQTARQRVGRSRSVSMKSKLLNAKVAGIAVAEETG